MYHTFLTSTTVGDEWRVSCFGRCRVDSNISVTYQFRVSAVRVVSDEETASHVFEVEPFVHSWRTEQAALIRYRHVTDKCESTFALREGTSRCALG
jgi:hypothetical protein